VPLKLEKSKLKTKSRSKIRVILEGRHLNVDGHATVGGAFVVSLDWDDVSVVAAGGDSHITIIGLAIVGGVEAVPAKVRDVNLAPRVRRLRADERVRGPVIKVTADVAGRDANSAAHAEHEMREILANAAT